MALFQVDPDHPFKGPHQGLDVAEHGPSLPRAKAAMVMAHGRGATAQSMFALAEEFAQPDFYFAAPQAYNHTWYPYSFLAPREKNQPGISSGLQALHDVIESITEADIHEDRIILLGFSQGACLATEFAARHPQKYGGIVALSGGLIGPEIEASDYRGSLEKTPVFLGCSDTDPHIPKERVDITGEVFDKLNAQVNKQIYPGMGHTINQDEIKTIRGMMTDILYH